jgi:AmmeMemoRadiSam system protein A
MLANLIRLMMKEEVKRFILKFTRSVIENFVKYRKILEIPENYPEELNEKRGVFVTLEKNGSLRGCIGIPYPYYKAIESLRSAAIGATQDPRFPPLEEKELKDIKIEVSILTEPKLVKVEDPSEYFTKIRKGIDGVIIKHGFNEALYLPQVWKEIPDELTFFRSLCMKAGLPPNAWKDKEAKIYKFQVESVKE